MNSNITSASHKIVNNTIDAHETNTNETNRTLIVGLSFCGKTYLLLNKLHLFQLSDTSRCIDTITRRPEQYTNIETNVSVEEDIEERTIRDYQNCCVVFDDMLDSNQKLTDAMFTRERHNDLDIYYPSQSKFYLSKRTIRNNWNIINLVQQTMEMLNIYTETMQVLICLIMKLKVYAGNPAKII